MYRRHFLNATAASAMGLALTTPRAALAQTPALVKPKRLSPGDTVAMVAPASATFKTVDLDVARESLEALGLKVKIGGHLLDRHGYLAGQDKDRADDINRFFADPEVRAVLPIRGGWGSSRLLPFLDFDSIRRNPKIVLGYSDITALLLSIHAKTGLVTFHGPNGMGRWDEFSVNWVKQILFDGQAATLENPHDKGEFLVQTENRIQTITPGTARGRILGGNLTVLTAIMGSPYLPNWDTCILFLEDVGEDIYRIDRMMTTLKLAGVLSRIRGFVFGTCSECEPEQGYGSLTLEEVFNDHIKPLNVPAWQGAMIGHRLPQFTIGEGIQVEIDAGTGRIRMLEAAVT
ncbi:MAG TPA: LD-carboxypeptidase [Vicinamibacterales bacterium]|jgi:muramoyltetrapeptide carboxypeptidase|nr:LD-carboxypeptidase [Vicinamibacterales bacterium]